MKRRNDSFWDIYGAAKTKPPRIWKAFSRTVSIGRHTTHHARARLQRRTVEDVAVDAVSSATKTAAR